MASHACNRSASIRSATCPQMDPLRAMRFLFLLAGVLMGGGGLGGAEFEPDVNTLLLAHFNETVHRADYALGLAELAGNGATLTDGYYGRAVDLRRRGLFEDFTKRCEGRNPLFDGWGSTPAAMWMSHKVRSSAGSAPPTPSVRGRAGVRCS